MEESQPPIMVFVNQKKDADGLARYIANITQVPKDLIA
jgi:ATP-dependent RNA helicase DDX23/PRP28